MTLWSYVDDKPFIRVLLDIIKADPQIDPDHIHLFGHAGGAIIGLLFGADFSRDFATLIGHTHWYYILGDWINEKALQCRQAYSRSQRLTRPHNRLV